LTKRKVTNDIKCIKLSKMNKRYKPSGVTLFFPQKVTTFLVMVTAPPSSK